EAGVDAFDVRGAVAGREVGGEVAVVVVVGRGTFDDLDVGVLRLVFGVELLEAHVAEEVEGEGDRAAALVGGGGVTAGPAAGGEDGRQKQSCGQSHSLGGHSPTSFPDRFA